MLRLLFMVVSVSASAIRTVAYIQSGKSGLPPVQTQAEAPKQQPVEKPKAQPVRLSGVERIPRGPRGHYEATFKINNARVHSLIDTGATSIALNESTARRAGIRLSRRDFKYPVNTANGQTMGAVATIRQVSIGSIRVRDVEAMVLKDEALGHTLIGMSFLNRLRGFEYASGNLVLRR